MKTKMKNILEKVVPVLKTKAFVLSFLASFSVVAVLFAIALIVSDVRNEIANEEAFREFPTPPRTLWGPTPPEPEEEPCDLPPYPTLFSALTGRRIYEGYAMRRPLAVVVNNIRASLPQSGIASADIVYEMLAEGDVTRFVAIFQSYIPEKIGSVRSARDYFVDFAWNHDAILVFHGASPGGHTRIRNTGITNLDGGRLEGQVFWRDRSFPEWVGNRGTRSLEHSSFTGRERIEAHIESAGIRDLVGLNPAYGFQFGEIEQQSIGTARRVVVPFSPNYTRTFIFDEEEQIYWVSNPAGPHLDAETEEQVAVTNILIQFAQMHSLGDYAGRRNINTLGEGRGYLATGGEQFPVRWQKSSHTSPTRWTFPDDTPITLSPGTTWVCVFQAGGSILFE
ncbi:MAG: DUF3048 domain-containing protein [Defluviitaleaceae bacterium]|nr:DUF3048 domain-containing protein [Defluviitaleaceae bacterium]MCL2262943.1 DUF3048 domain-containing protein [Defluviitaleaceae bacterium]